MRTQTHANTHAHAEPLAHTHTSTLLTVITVQVLWTINILLLFLCMLYEVCFNEVIQCLQDLTGPKYEMILTMDCVIISLKLEPYGKSNAVS